MGRSQKTLIRNVSVDCYANMYGKRAFRERLKLPTERC